MTTKSRKKSAGSGGNKQQAPTQKLAYASQYIGIDSHLVERNGSTDDVLGIAAERPAGRKLADDIAKHCNQLHTDGYDVIAIFPLISGRTVGARAVAEIVPGRTYHLDSEGNARIDGEEHTPRYVDLLRPSSNDDNEHYVDTGVGYSVTDGVMIIAKLTEQSQSS